MLPHSQTVMEKHWEICLYQSPSHEQIRIVEKLNAVMAHVIEYGTIDSRSKHLNNIFPERLKNPFSKKPFKVNLYHKTLTMNQPPFFWNVFVQRSKS